MMYDDKPTGCPSMNRRAFLGLSAGFAAWAGLPGTAGAADAAEDPRLVVLVLHGGLDGLALAAPTDDPVLAELRGDLAFPGGLALDGTFVLNPLMVQLHRLFQDGEALIAHAVATPYRDRSHFAALDVLQSGFPVPRAARSGWLHRALAALPQDQEPAVPQGVALDDRVPHLLAGNAVPVANWTTRQVPLASVPTNDRVLELYRETDPDLAEALQAGLRLQRLATGAVGDEGSEGAAAADALAAARLLAQPGGPRVAVLGTGGWDTHRDEVTRLHQRLLNLDAMIGALRTGLAGTWRRTVVMVVTEFGRAVAINGSKGSDHGTATVALLMGGAVAGGRMVADWPGLAEAQLFEGRDLRPTLDLRALGKGVLRDHLRVSEAVLEESVFPGSALVRPYEGLIL